MDAIAFDAKTYHQFPDYPEKELEYMQFLCKKHGVKTETSGSAIVQEIQKVRENIKTSLENKGGWAERMEAVEGVINQMLDRIKDLEATVQRLNKLSTIEIPCIAKAPSKPAPAPAEAAKVGDDDDDDVDLFGSDDEDAEKLKEVKEKANAAAKKAKPVAKSMIVLDVKPWDDTTDMKELEDGVRAITHDGLLWGTSKLVPLVHGIKKLQIACVVEDDKVGTDFLEERIMELEGHVQSVDIASFNKL